MPPVADGSLGSRYWITTDLLRLSELYEAEVGSGGSVAAAGPSVEPEKGVIGNDSVLTTLANGSESAIFMNVSGQAKKLASLLGEEGKTREMAVTVAKDQLSILKPSESFENLVEKVVRVSGRYIPDELKKADVYGGDIGKLAQFALARILLSKDFAERAHVGGELDREGMMALVNATIGLMKMACEGKVDIRQPGDCMFGEVTDLSKPADVLRLAVKTAQIAREKFVDEDGLRDMVNLAVDRAPQHMNADELREELQEEIDHLIELRKEASQCLDVTFDLGNASPRTLRNKLNAVRKALRAFRYDLDRAGGKKMGFMESVRRKFDDWFSSAPGRMPPGHYGMILDCESRIKGILSRYGVGAAGFQDVKNRAELATGMTHATNNHIRYFFSGAETRREKFAKQAHEMFDPLVEKGGSKTVSFEVGLDVRAGFKVGDAVGLDMRAGGKFVHTAKVSVSPGGGEVTVTYYDGVAAEGSVDGNVGIGKWNGEDTDKAKLGANFNGKGEIGGGKGRTVTYPSLDAFIADCNGENSLVDVGPAHSFLCLGKIYQGCRALARGARNLLAKLGFVIHKSVVDSRSYRAMLQRNGVMRKVDSILSNAPRHIQKTSEKTYDVFKGGVGGGGGMNVKKFRGIDEKYQTEKSASVFDLKGSFGYSGERQFNVRGRELRARIDTLRMESAEMLRYRLELAADDYDTKDLVEGFGNDGEDISRLAERLVDLENEATECGDDREKWRRICRRLNALTVRYVHLERELETGGDAKRLESARTFFAERLSNPQMDIPENIFRDMLVDVTSRMRAGKSIHKANFKVGYNVGTDFVTDVAKSSPSSLQPEKTVVDGKTVIKDLTYGQQFAQTMISNPIATGLGELGAKGSIDLAVTVEKPGGVDIRPWKNDTTVLFDIKLEPNLPVRVLVEHIASKYVDSLTGEGSRPEDVASVKNKVMGEVLASICVGITMETLVTEYANLTVKKLVDEQLGKGVATGAQKFFAGPLVKSAFGVVPLTGLETGMDMNYSKSIQFRFEHGRLACLSVTEDEKMESSLGVRFKAGPVGIGLHMKTGYSKSQIERSVYESPHFDTLLGRTAEFLRGGTRSQLSLFLAHNKVGALKAFDRSTPTGSVVSTRIDKAERMLNRIAEWYEDKSSKPGELSLNVRSLADRAAGIQAMLAKAGREFSTCEDSTLEADRLKALEELLVALVRAYDIAKEADQLPDIRWE